MEFAYMISLDKSIYFGVTISYLNIIYKLKVTLTLMNA